MVIPPSTRTRSAGEAVEAFARTMAELLERVSRTLADRPVSRDEAHGWLREQRAIAHHTAHLDRVLTEAQESRRLNPRAAGSWDPVPDLRSGLDALEHSAVTLRLVLRSIADGARGSLLSGLDRVLEELDLDTFSSARDRRRREVAERTRPSTQAAKRLRSSARRVATEYPIVRRRSRPR